MQYKYYMYQYTVLQDKDDFIAKCEEFPSLSWIENNPQDSYNSIQKLIEEILEDMYTNGKSPPVPNFF